MQATQQPDSRDEKRLWLAARKEAEMRIDPSSAEVEVTFWWTQVLDPYGVWPDLPPEADCVGRSHFARSPNSDGWVFFGDLPAETRDELWRKLRSGELEDSFEKDFVDLLVGE